jgi:valyl-tRNA synthetase
VPLTIVPASPRARAAIEEGLPYLSALARVRPIELRADGAEEGRPELVASTADAAAWFGDEAATTAEAAAHRASGEAHLRRGIERLQALLSSEFAERAPAEVVERERARLADLEGQLRLLLGR